uniref:PaaD zinc beta ribbon domain-containing protein n=1 Tax=viral metagenome TaxID=1070528 RepID=A0A6M3L317_9ZZZZ
MGDLYSMEQGHWSGKDKKVPMTKNSNYNFVPVIICPYCERKQRAAISGFGGTISKRWKVCKFCEKEFDLIIDVKSIKK